MAFLFFLRKLVDHLSHMHFMKMEQYHNPIKIYRANPTRCRAYIGIQSAVASVHAQTHSLYTWRMRYALQICVLRKENQIFPCQNRVESILYHNYSCNFDRRQVLVQQKLCSYFISSDWIERIKCLKHLMIFIKSESPFEITLLPMYMINAQRLMLNAQCQRHTK